MSEETFTIDAQFAGKEPMVRSIYDRLLTQLRAFGPVREEPKKTSIHLANGSGFAGVHTRRAYLLLNIRTEKPIESKRIVKSEQVSKSRYHQEIRLDSAEQVDSELLGWLRSAYDLSPTRA
jgi:hypothetical protein